MKFFAFHVALKVIYVDPKIPPLVAYTLILFKKYTHLFICS
jgi:hypothetical protein